MPNLVNAITNPVQTGQALAENFANLPLQDKLVASLEVVLPFKSNIESLAGRIPGVGGYLSGDLAYTAEQGITLSANGKTYGFIGDGVGNQVAGPFAAQAGSVGGIRFGEIDASESTIAPNRISVPGDADFIGPSKPGNWDALTANSEAHAFSVHGGDVTAADLATRATTGLKPNGQPGPIPPLSSAFYSDNLLISTDQAIRDSGGLQNAIVRQPDQSVVRVETQDVGDLGTNLGYGYQRIGATGNQPFNGSVQGPLLRIDNLRSAQGIYEFNSVTNQWETITVYPAPH